MTKAKAELQDELRNLQEEFEDLELRYDRLEEAYCELECKDADVSELIENRIQLDNFIYWLKLEDLYSDEFEKFVEYYMKYRNQEGAACNT